MRRRRQRRRLRHGHHQRDAHGVQHGARLRLGAGCELRLPRRRSSGPRRRSTRRPAQPAVTGEVTATVTTTIGDMTFTLDADKAPCTVNSFVSLAQQDYFDGTHLPPAMTTERDLRPAVRRPDRHPAPAARATPSADELDGSETYPAGTLAMANRRPQHQRLAVLHRVRRHAARRRTTRSSARSTMRPSRRSRQVAQPGHRRQRRSGRWPRPRRTVEIEAVTLG